MQRRRDVQGLIPRLCIVKITSPVAVTGVALNKTTDSLAVNATDKLVATVTPTNATTTTVTFASSDATVATVASDGTVTGVKAGTATITATTADGSYTAACVVTVTAA
ncbi:Ig-like domain-containing protein [Paucilactobacillus suebicus]|uniref:Ig-like domain-containing protein n=1 Tax=Paucilactobacillus suebicus TaxID=152335 RepID=UPI0009D9BC7B